MVQFAHCLEALAFFGVALTVAGCQLRPAPPLPGVAARFAITSPTFSYQGRMPLRCGANLGNVSPGLEWKSVPLPTKSLALVMEDLDSPGPSPFVHWVLPGIPPSSMIKEGVPPAGSKSGSNDAGTRAYLGPKPPNGTRRDVIPLYALDIELRLAAEATKAALVQAMAGHELAMGELTGLYAAK